MPDPSLQRCMEFAARVEGYLWCVAKIFFVREEVDISAALGWIFCAITTDSRQRETVGEVDGKPAPSGDVGRGANRRRPWVKLDDDDVIP